MSALTRRMALGAGLATLAIPSLAFGVASQKRLVVVVLRGGMDGIAAVAPIGDPAYRGVRGDLALTQTLPLNTTFGMHPRLATLHESYRVGECAIIHATSTPYRERSHFDAQNVLEAGTVRAFSATDGWLNRALGARAAGTALGAVAIGTGVPLALRGAAPATSWAPSLLPDPNADLVTRTRVLYAQDAALARALADAQAIHAAAGAGQAGGQFAQQMAAAARFLAQPDGPRVAMLELAGWDTHATQAQPAGALARNLRQLDAGVAALAEGLGVHWARTVIVIASEFGRTVAVNGTLGTDHGSGGAVFVAGGAVRGGRVLADWPGLAMSQRYQGRDLAATLDLRALLKGLLHDHLEVPSAALDTQVFPDSAASARLRDLLG